MFKRKTQTSTTAAIAEEVNPISPGAEEDEAKKLNKEQKEAKVAQLRTAVRKHKEEIEGLTYYLNVLEEQTLKVKADSSWWNLRSLEPEHQKLISLRNSLSRTRWKEESPKSDKQTILELEELVKTLQTEAERLTALKNKAEETFKQALRNGVERWGTVHQKLFEKLNSYSERFNQMSVEESQEIEKLLKRIDFEKTKIEKASLTLEQKFELETVDHLQQAFSNAIKQIRFRKLLISKVLDDNITLGIIGTGGAKLSSTQKEVLGSVLLDEALVVLPIENKKFDVFKVSDKNIFMIPLLIAHTEPWNEATDAISVSGLSETDIENLIGLYGEGIYSSLREARDAALSLR